MEYQYNEKLWLVIPTSITGSINFSQVQEPNVNALRLNIAGTETFVKYEVTVVPETYEQEYINAETGQPGYITIYAGTYGRPDIYQPEYPEYLHDPMLELLSTPEWTDPLNPITEI
jgi:hypothetical protein